jgi:hypothetical protein
VEDRRDRSGGQKSDEVGKISLVNPIILANLKRVDEAEVKAGIMAMLQGHNMAVLW